VCSTFRANFHANFRANFHANFRANFHANFRANFRTNFRANFNRVEDAAHSRGRPEYFRWKNF
jgi:hypothetical protein